MSEVMKPLTGEERTARIKDIRARKGHLLGKLATNDSKDYLKYSVLVLADGRDEAYSGYFGSDFGYMYKGEPDSAIRQADPNQSEYAEVRRPLAQLEATPEQTSACSHVSGRMAMNQAVERQQRMLAEDLASECQNAEEARTNRLGRYVELLGNRTELADETVVDEFNGLVREFYIPRNVEEECLIMDAGGSTYGV